MYPCASGTDNAMFCWASHSGNRIEAWHNNVNDKSQAFPHHPLPDTAKQSRTPAPQKIGDDTPIFVLFSIHPPLPIQKKIADTLNRASILIEKRKVQIGKLELLRKSLMQQYFC